LLVDIQKIPDGWRVRVYKGRKIAEREAGSANDAIDIARTMVSSMQRLGT
jgi:hypothetical protein